MHPLFSNCQVDYQNYLNIKTYTRNEVIFNEGQICKTIGLVIKGNVQINTYTLNEEYNITNVNSGETFGETLLFTNNPHYLGDVISTKESQIAFINKSNLVYLLQHDTILLNNYLSIISNKGLANQKRVKVLVQKNIRDKIMFYLFNEAKTLQSNIIPIISKEQLAKLLNIPRPSLSRELISMKKDKLLDFDRYTITLSDSCIL
jgi:CRP-like cAMP-binding protein